MSILDLDAIARSAAEHVATRVLEKLPDLVRAELERREQDRLMSQPQLAAYCGKSAKAMRMFLSRPAGKELLDLARPMGERRCWSKADVDAYFARRK